MEIKILTQTRDTLVSVEGIVMEGMPHHSIALKGIRNDETIVLGQFRTAIAAERVLLNIVKRLNLLPDAICVIPEDDEDIMNCCDVSALPGQVSDV